MTFLKFNKSVLATALSGIGLCVANGIVFAAQPCSSQLNQLKVIGTGSVTGGAIYQALNCLLNSGAQGAQGPQGAQGAQGATGAQGVTGAIGPQGSDEGPQGPQGPQGFQGNTGATGSEGSQGPQGFQGAQGPQGFQGTTGATGSEGSQGPQGFQGSQGPQGFQGDQGSQGPQGFQGAQGSQGFQGNPGFQGATGNDGVQGAQGALGPQGPTGSQGATGPQGPQGYQGGPQGPQGDQGPQGSTGDQGPQGFQGATGPQGAQGPSGFRLSVKNWQDACLSGSATGPAGCVVDTSSVGYLSLDKMLGGASDTMNVTRGQVNGGFIKVFGRGANPAGMGTEISVMTTSPARCAVYHTSGRSLDYPLQNITMTHVSPHMNHVTVKAVQVAVPTAFTVYANDHMKSGYALNDGVVVFCLGLSSFNGSIGGSLIGTTAAWS